MKTFSTSAESFTSEIHLTVTVTENGAKPDTGGFMIGGYGSFLLVEKLEDGVSSIRWDKGDHELGTVYRMSTGDYEATDGFIYRNADCPFKAAAKLIGMIV